MKKLISLLLLLALVLSCAAAGADFASATSIDGGEARSIKVHTAPKENPWPEDNTSPTTGRDLNNLMIDVFTNPDNEGFQGMVATGEYYPIMVQHCGTFGATGIAAPWYGSYADIYYEFAKTQVGDPRMCMLFNDVIPVFAGPSRSTRVGYIWLRQEWKAPYFYQGRQEGSWPGAYDTNVNHAVAALKLNTNANDRLDPATIDLFDGINSDNKPGNTLKEHVYGVSGEESVIWRLAEERTDVLGERTFPNHTWLFTEDEPLGGDSAEFVYVLFNNRGATTGGGQRVNYLNSMYQYDEEENVYYRYLITNLKNPDLGALPFVEQRAANARTEERAKASNPNEKGAIKLERIQGDPITFANIIIQYIDEKWPSGQCPYPILTGEGNADFFMAGKHLKGVWKRDTYDDRTVFYGPDGEEIQLQVGRTMVVMLDHGTLYQKNKIREVRYE